MVSLSFFSYIPFIGSDLPFIIQINKNKILKIRKSFLEFQKNFEELRKRELKFNKECA